MFPWIVALLTACPVTVITDVDEHQVLLVDKAQVLAAVGDGLERSCDESALRLGQEPALVLTRGRDGWQVAPPALRSRAETEALAHTLDSVRLRSAVRVEGHADMRALREWVLKRADELREQARVAGLPFKLHHGKSIGELSQEYREKDLYWSADGLCVAQGTGGDTVRCYQWHKGWGSRRPRAAPIDTGSHFRNCEVPRKDGVTVGLSGVSGEGEGSIEGECLVLGLSPDRRWAYALLSKMTYDSVCNSPVPRACESTSLRLYVFDVN